ncbi:hypothetical protein [Anaerotignum propionicum]|uniref:Uncharacterized protein n=1 Tax=Anaerotignum propionicum DSM 1682 TaxID=991789 RepID=A0A0X8VC36_ANAPI|nr:hypothetical protein [Anaerotignum propionicum]AMJ40349.1 hypothetical protein CPRO_07480 [Anaerotignum propionicum DSM 1682]SHE44436.1 hypothetical protein SAMN02745151_00731 [[Clostridium] propionicum DSM 1682] [Anaerotignum propionicum DSM 1682]
MPIEQRAHELALLYMERYMVMRDIQEPEQLVIVYKQVYSDYLEQLSRN